jgi:hypothetical protein
MASLSLTSDDFGQPKENIEWTVDVTVGMMAQDKPCQSVAGSELKLGEQTDRHES